MSDFTDDFVTGAREAIPQGIDIYNRTRSFRLMQAQFDIDKEMREKEAVLKEADDARRQAEFDAKMKEIEAREKALEELVNAAKPTGASVTKAVGRGEKVTNPFDFLIKQHKIDKAQITLDPEGYLKRKIPPTEKEQADIGESRARAKYYGAMGRAAEGKPEKKSDFMQLMDEYVRIKQTPESQRTPEDQILYNDVLLPKFASPKLTKSDMMDWIRSRREFLISEEDWEDFKIKDETGKTLKGRDAKKYWEIQTGRELFPNFDEVWFGIKPETTEQTQTTNPINELPQGWLNNAQP